MLLIAISEIESGNDSDFDSKGKSFIEEILRLRKNILKYI